MTEVPVIDLAGMSETEKRAYILADNKIALNAGWYTEMLGLELGEIGALGFDLSLTGFGEDEIASLGRPGLTGPDDVPEPEERVASRAGDSWLPGRHRLLCGDSTNAIDVRWGVSGSTYASDAFGE